VLRPVVTTTSFIGGGGARRTDDEELGTVRAPLLVRLRGCRRHDTRWLRVASAAINGTTAWCQGYCCHVYSMRCGDDADDEMGRPDMITVYCELANSGT
jgi:hypothetical protein